MHSLNLVELFLLPSKYCTSLGITVSHISTKLGSRTGDNAFSSLSTWIPRTPPTRAQPDITWRMAIGSLNNNDGEGYKSVVLKVNSRCLKLYRVYSISFNSSNVGKLFWRWILKGCTRVQEKKKEVVVFCSRPQQIVKLGSSVHVVVVQRRQRNVQKSVMNEQSCCFANILKPIGFLLFSLLSSSSLR